MATPELGIALIWLDAEVRLGRESTRTLRRDAVLPAFYPATAMPNSDWWEALWRRPWEVIGLLGVGPGGEVVDLCCGDGPITVPLVRIARRGLPTPRRASGRNPWGEDHRHAMMDGP